jgi:hypothetical protein
LGFSLRGYIFTDVEREIIDTYLNKGIKVKDFYVLLTRIRANYSRLKEDMDLLERVLYKGAN